MNTALIKPQWSPLTITLMVLGFIIFWPLGLAMLAYILWGERLGGAREKAEGWFSKNKCHFSPGGFGPTGNAAFDDYRAERLAQLEEERRRLDQERADFEDYLANLRKARDREEFDRFMRERQNGHGGENTAY